MSTTLLADEKLIHVRKIIFVTKNWNIQKYEGVDN